MIKIAKKLFFGIGFSIVLIFANPLLAQSEAPKQVTQKEQQKNAAKKEKEFKKADEKAKKDYRKRQSKQSKKNMKRTKRKSDRQRKGKKAPFWESWFRK